MLPSHHPTIAIIGGGVSGPALALSLKKHHGISSTIYELRPDGDERGVNIALSPNAVRVLQHVGVYDDLRKQGFSYEDLVISNAKSQYIGKICQGSRSRYNFACLRIHRAEVQRSLLKEVEAQGIPVVFGKKLVGLKEQEGNVELQFEDGTTANADFVIGADGVHSNVRNLIMNTEIGYNGFMGIIGMGLKKSKMHDSIREVTLPNFVFGKTGFVAIMPSNYEGTEVDFFSTMPYPSHTREEWSRIGDDKAELQRILQSRFGKDWPQFVTGLTQDYEKEGLELYPFFEVPPLDRWMSISGRVILAGQGAAVGLEDAETLAHTMSHDGFAKDHLRFLKIWEAHRKTRLAHIKRLTDINGRLRSPDPPVVQYLKEWVMWGNFKWTGPTGQLEWLFAYNAEDILNLF